MNATLLEFLAADRAAQLLREAESKRLARLARAGRPSLGLTVASMLGAVPTRLRRHQPVAPPVSC